MDSVPLNGLITFLKTTAGIVLTAEKLYLINSRLQPLCAKYDCKSVEELARKLMASPPAALKQDVVEAMTTNETSFFRDLAPFDIFRNHVLPALLERRKAQKNIRILCLAASSGQEPYSLAMILAENAARLPGWRTDILGVDIDTTVLKRAQEGIYTQFEVQRGLPIAYLMKYFEKRPDATWALKPQIRGMVQFRFCNLLEPLTSLGQFDIVFCRNVLIYFDPPTKKNVLDRVATQMAPDGYLFLGAAETVLDISARFTAAPTQRGLYVPSAGVAAAQPTTAAKPNTATSPAMRIGGAI
jgi:chemotaxis protein methyltransferase CheR